MYGARSPYGYARPPLRRSLAAQLERAHLPDTPFFRYVALLVILTSLYWLVLLAFTTPGTTQLGRVHHPEQQALRSAAHRPRSGGGGAGGEGGGGGGGQQLREAEAVVSLLEREAGEAAESDDSSADGAGGAAGGGGAGGGGGGEGVRGAGFTADLSPAAAPHLVGATRPATLRRAHRPHGRLSERDRGEIARRQEARRREAAQRGPQQQQRGGSASAAAAHGAGGAGDGEAHGGGGKGGKSGGGKSGKGDPRRHGAGAAHRAPPRPGDHGGGGGGAHRRHHPPPHGHGGKGKGPAHPHPHPPAHPPPGQKHKHQPPPPSPPPPPQKQQQQKQPPPLPDPAAAPSPPPGARAVEVLASGGSGGVPAKSALSAAERARLAAQRAAEDDSESDAEGGGGVAGAGAAKGAAQLAPHLRRLLQQARSLPLVLSQRDLAAPGAPGAAPGAEAKPISCASSGAVGWRSWAEVLRLTDGRASLLPREPVDLFAESRKWNSSRPPSPSLPPPPRGEVGAGVGGKGALGSGAEGAGGGGPPPPPPRGRRLAAAAPPAEPAAASRGPACAVVGNGGRLRDESYGEAIDRADFVFRFNNAVTRGFERQVGTRSSLRLLNGPYAAPMKSGEMTAAQVRDGSLRNWLDERAKRPEVPAFVVHPEVLCNAWSWVGRKGGRPSSGLVGVVMALAMCSSVDLYGFQFGAYFNASERPHYWDWERPKPGRERVHPFEEEARVYGDLERAGLLRVH